MGTSDVISFDARRLQSEAAGNSSAIVSTMHAKSDIGVVVALQDEPQLEDLLQAIAQQDRVAFAKFYDLTTNRAMSLVVRITQSISIAEEVVSEVYLQIWRQADRFDPSRGNALAWLTILCRSRALDTIRKESTAPTTGAVPISEAPEQVATGFPQDLLLATERRSAVHAALEQLNPEQRQLLALAYFRGYSHSELADFTGVPLGTVKSQLRRTLMKLKELVVASENEDQVQP